jgi:phosphoglycerate kinase
MVCHDCIGDDAVQKAKYLRQGEVLLLENLRFYKEEEKGDKEFAKKLAALGTVYVNDAFGTAHRAHASTAIIAENFPDKNSSVTSWPMK